MKIVLPHEWQPRPDQLAMWSYLEQGGKRAVQVAHRRWGKDDVSLHWTATAAMQRAGNFWHMLPMANQARKAIWDAINPKTGRRRIDDAFPDAIRETTRESDMFIRFVNGSTWQVVGSDNFAGVIGSPPVGVVFSEWSLADPEAWSQIRPILMENGGWAIFIYTPKGKNHGFTTLEFAKSEPGWFHQVLPASETQVFSPESLEAELREYISEYGEDDGQAYFDQEYNCSFSAPLIGSYYGSYLSKARNEGRVCHVPYEPGVPVWTAWDLGRSDDTAIWFAQRRGVQVRIIDYYRSSGHTMDHYAKILQDKQYVYAGHIMPHDAGSKKMHAPNALDMQAMELGLQNVITLKNESIDSGIHAARQLLPICEFDEKKCAQGLNALESYHREWDDKRKMFKDEPCHDWASHPADAFRYLAMGLPKNVAYTPPKEPEYITVGGKSTMTWNTLTREHDRQKRQRAGRI